MSLREILQALDVIGLGMLLGGAVYESVVMAPNYRADVPRSLEHVRRFMKAATPASYFRLLSSATMLALLATVVVCWASPTARWAFGGALLGLVLADAITFAFHYPRNKVLFLDPLSSDHDLLRRVAREWGRGNLVRILILTVAMIAAIRGLQL